MACLVAPLAAAAPPSIPGADLFSSDKVLQIQIEIAPQQIVSLRNEPRKSVAAIVREGTSVFTNVTVHLKGSTGSFRPIDATPAMTLSFGKSGPEDRFHGLRKIHLNNSVEDPSRLNELAGAELVHAAQLPAPRVARAMVVLNRRPLGLYVLKEGFTEDFLSLNFKRTGGNLYDTGPGHDVDEPMTKQLGAHPDDASDLKALAAAAQEPDLAKRWPRLGQVLDTDRFISFMAMEVMIDHRDGYCLARNNFRIYHDMDADRMVFFPHGMDQLFGKADLAWRPKMSGRVARAILETPEGSRLYRERFSFLLTNVFNAEVLSNRIDQWVQSAQSALSSADGRALKREAAMLQERILQRKTDLQRQLSLPELKPLAFENGIARLTQWTVGDGAANCLLNQAKWPDGRPALHIKALGDTSASWRSKVLLPRGRYRLEGCLSTAGVTPLLRGKNQGAGLRVSGLAASAPYQQIGDAQSKRVQIEFDSAPALAEMEFVCELRARQGEAWFELDSLRLVRLQP
jgi:hypothetical protein